MFLKTLIKTSILILTLVFCVTLKSQTIIPGGYVSGTWDSSGSPYLIQDNILIHPDSTLTIGASTYVLFFSKKMLEIQGQLIVNGTPGNFVLFDGDQDTTTWYGLFFNTTDTSITDSSILENGDIRHCEGRPCITIEQSSRVRINGFSICYGDAFRGGGISCISSNPYFEDLFLAYNFALDGAGISLDHSSPVMKNCSICQNTAYGAGGGMVIFDYSNPLIIHCAITGNQSTGSGGGVYVNNASPVFRYTIIDWNEGAMGNSNLYSGGGVSVKLACYPVFENCIFGSNHCHRGGGGIASFSYTTIINCLFKENTATESGGALYLSSGNPLESTLINNTFSDNYSAAGSVLYAHNHVANMKNCIAWNSDPSDTSSLFWLDAIMALDALDVSYSDLQKGPSGIELTGNAGYTWGTGNIVLEPIFLPGNYDLDWQSPCIEAGTPDTTGLGLPELDLNNNPRYANDRIDMGAFEYQLALALPNFNFPVSNFCSIFPNPARDWVYVEIEENKEICTIELMNGSGLVLSKQDLPPGEKTAKIDLRGYAAGIYLLRMLENGIVTASKVIIND